MAHDLRTLVVIDVEATCWDARPPQGQHSEIIEVGLCDLDMKTLEIIPESRDSWFIKPVRSTVSEFCTNLTGITPEALEKGETLEEVCARLKNRIFSKAGPKCWASWGDFDRRKFDEDCSRSGVKWPFGPSHLNVKNLFAQAWGLPAGIGLIAALEKLGLKFEGKHHTGKDDAFNIARVASELLYCARGISETDERTA